MLNIYQYLDYRKFLKDAFEEQKQRRPQFSHRVFSRLAGFKSSNFLMLVMQGKRNLSEEAIPQVAKALKLKKAEAQFFACLVRFNQAKTTDEQNTHYRQVASSRLYAASRLLEKELYEYYSTWYHAAVRELVTLKDFREDPAWVAKKIQPSITPRQAAESLELLKHLGLISYDAGGRLVQREPYVRTSDEVESLAVANFHREMLSKAALSIDQTPAQFRDLSSITFAVSKEKMGEAKRMIQEFRKRLSAFLSEEQDAQAVYQFNLQLFNVSTLPEDWK